MPAHRAPPLAGAPRSPTPTQERLTQPQEPAVVDGLTAEAAARVDLGVAASARVLTVPQRCLYFALLRASPMMMVELADECAARAGLPPSGAMLAGAAPLPP